MDLSRSVGPEPQVYRGIEAAERFWLGWIDTWELWHSEITELIDAGDRVVAIGRAHGRGRGTGGPVEAGIHNVFTLRDCRVVRSCIFKTKSEALEAVRLSEQDAHAES